MIVHVQITLKPHAPRCWCRRVGLTDNEGRRRCRRFCTTPDIVVATTPVDVDVDADADAPDDGRGGGGNSGMLDAWEGAQF